MNRGNKAILPESLEERVDRPVSPSPSPALWVYVVLVQHIEELLNCSLDDRQKISSIQQLIRDARNDEGMPDDDRC